MYAVHSLVPGTKMRSLSPCPQTGVFGLCFVEFRTESGPAQSPPRTPPVATVGLISIIPRSATGYVPTQSRAQSETRSSRWCCSHCRQAAGPTLSPVSSCVKWDKQHQSRPGSLLAAQKGHKRPGTLWTQLVPREGAWFLLNQVMCTSGICTKCCPRSSKWPSQHTRVGKAACAEFTVTSLS